MLKAYIFPKSLTKWGRIFKSMECFHDMIEYICKSCEHICYASDVFILRDNQGDIYLP